ncbi:MAG TPA: S8 family serine peptidase [Gemmatimonadaceae bacterium]|nr:S8 family serine peptidase [Gemmatimonadaceae bacterium]
MAQSIPTGRRTHVCASLAMVGLVALTLSACQDSVAPSSQGTRAPGASAARDSQNAGSRIPDQYIVVLDDSVNDVGARATSLMGANNAGVGFTYTAALKGFSAHMSAQAAAALQNAPGVALVEQDQTVTVSGMTSSSGIQKPAWVWGLDRVDQRGSTLDTTYHWLGDGSGVTVYILDTGIRITHQDFGGRASYGPDLVSNTSSNDCNGHGTHMAGTVGGSYYGAAKAVSLVAVRVLDCSGTGTASTAIAGLDWVTRNHVGPSVANLSFTGPLSSTLNQAVANAIAAGVTVVTSAGDNGIPPDACQYSPSSAPDGITVGAMRQTDIMAGFSNYGPCVDLFAPGFSITSDWWTGDNIVWALDGTSSAAAHVSGAAAIYLSLYPSSTPSQVASAIVGSATSGALGQLGTNSPNLLLYTGDFSGSAPAPSPPPPTTNAAPTASFTVSCSKANCSYNASASTDDVGIVSYAWNFGDGTSQTTTSATTTHTYTTKGKYSVTITLTVTDGGGLTGTAQKTVTITNRGK